MLPSHSFGVRRLFSTPAFTSPAFVSSFSVVSSTNFSNLSNLTKLQNLRNFGNFGNFVNSGKMEMSTSSSSSSQTGHKDVTTKIQSEHNKNIIWSDALLTKEQRQEHLKSKHSGVTLWITGLSGSGKSTIGAALELALLESGIHAYRLDGDNIRFGLNKGLGFSAEDRSENLRRISEVSALFADAGIVAITTFISPYLASRKQAREIHEKKGVKFVEIYAKVPLEVAEKRDPKGLYKKARKGELKGFTGIDDVYEAPESAEIVIETDKTSVKDACQKMIQYLKDTGVIKV